jgi:hypothetical protein
MSIEYQLEEGCLIIRDKFRKEFEEYWGGKACAFAKEGVSKLTVM